LCQQGQSSFFLAPIAKPLLALFPANLLEILSSQCSLPYDTIIRDNQRKGLPKRERKQLAAR
jgi:hypothetical protein